MLGLFDPSSVADVNRRTSRDADHVKRLDVNTLGVICLPEGIFALPWRNCSNRRVSKIRFIGGAQEYEAS